MAETESVLGRRVRLLQEEARKFSMLMEQPEPGLSTWFSMVPQSVAEMQAILDGKRDAT